MKSAESRKRKRSQKSKNLQLSKKQGPTIGKIPLAFPTDALPTPRLAPWSSLECWFRARVGFARLCHASPLEAIADEQLMSASQVSVSLQHWDQAGGAPVALVACSNLLAVCSQYIDVQTSQVSMGIKQVQLASVRLAAGNAILRFVNSIADHSRKGKAKASMASSLASSAERAGIPRYLVDLRHAAAHGNMPTWPALAFGMQQALRWVEQKYWSRQEAVLLEEHTAAEFVVQAALKDLLKHEARQHLGTAKLAGEQQLAQSSSQSSTEACAAGTTIGSGESFSPPQLPWWVRNGVSPLLMMGSALRVRPGGSTYAAWSPADAAELAQQLKFYTATVPGAQSSSTSSSSSSGNATDGRARLPSWHTVPAIDPHAGQWASWYTVWARHRSKEAPGISPESACKVTLGDLGRGTKVVDSVRALCSLCKGRPGLTASHVLPRLLGPSQHGAPSPGATSQLYRFNECGGLLRRNSPESPQTDVLAAAEKADEWANRFLGGCDSSTVAFARHAVRPAAWLLALAHYTDSTVLISSHENAMIQGARAGIIQAMGGGSPVLQMRRVSETDCGSALSPDSLLEQLRHDASPECEIAGWQRWMPVLVCLQRAEPSTWGSLIRASCRWVAVSHGSIVQAELALRHISRAWATQEDSGLAEMLKVCAWSVGCMKLLHRRAGNLVHRLLNTESCAAFGITRGAAVGEGSILSSSLTASKLNGGQTSASLAKLASNEAQGVVDSTLKSLPTGQALSSPPMDGEMQHSGSASFVSEEEEASASTSSHPRNTRGKGRKGRKQPSKAAKEKAAQAERAALALDEAKQQVEAEKSRQAATIQVPDSVLTSSIALGCSDALLASAMAAGVGEYGDLITRAVAVRQDRSTSESMDGGCAPMGGTTPDQAVDALEGNDSPAFPGDREPGSDADEEARVTEADVDSSQGDSSDSQDEGTGVGVDGSVTPSSVLEVAASSGVGSELDGDVSGPADAPRVPPGGGARFHKGQSDDEEDDDDCNDDDDTYSIKIDDDIDGHGLSADSTAVGETGTLGAPASRRYETPELEVSGEVTFGEVESAYRRDIVKPGVLPLAECARVLTRLSGMQLSGGTASQPALGHAGALKDTLSTLEQALGHAVEQDAAMNWRAGPVEVSLEDAYILLHTSSHEQRPPPSRSVFVKAEGRTESGRLGELEMLEQLLSGGAASGGGGATASSSSELDGTHGMKGIAGAGGIPNSLESDHIEEDRVRKWPLRCPIIQVPVHPAEVLAEARNWEIELAASTAGDSFMYSAADDGAAEADWEVVEACIASWAAPGVAADGSNQCELIDLIE